MKKMTCAEMGGPAECTHEITGATAEEMAKNGGDHVVAAHPEMAEKMKAMTPEEHAKWLADFTPKFAAAPEV